MCALLLCYSLFNPVHSVHYEFYQSVDIESWGAFATTTATRFVCLFVSPFPACMQTFQNMMWAVKNT